MTFLTRLKFHTYRYRGEILYSSIILASFMVMIALAFPKDNEAIAGYVNLLSSAGLDALFSTIDINAPGWIFWVSLMGTVYTYYVSAIAGVRIGSKLYPTKDKAAMELISSSPMHPQQFYIENIGAALIASFIMFFPSFVVLAIYSLIQESPDTIPRLVPMFILSAVVVIFFIALSSLPTTLRFSQSAGSKVAYLYMISGFLIELTANTMTEYKDYANLSVNTYIMPSGGLLTGEFNWEEGGIVLIISAVLFLLSTFFIARPDFIERIGRKRKFNLSFLPSFSPQGKLAKKYPLLFDQFRKDRSFFFIWMLAVDIAFVYINAIFYVAIKDDPSILSAMTVGFGGILDAFTFGYSSPPSYVGFLTFELFGLLWLYFGLFVFIPAINIPTRDQINDEQDLIWSNSITPSQVIMNRTLSVTIFFTLYYWSSFVALMGSAILFDLGMDTVVLLMVYAVGYIYFLGLTFLFVGMTMLFPIRTGKKITLWFYVVSIFMMMTSFLVPSVDYLKYFSIAYYFDSVGLVLEKLNVLEELLIAVIILALSVVLYFSSLKFKYQHQDMLL